MSTRQNYGASASNTTPNEPAVSKSARIRYKIEHPAFQGNDKRVPELYQIVEGFLDETPISADLDVLGEMLEASLRYECVPEEGDPDSPNAIYELGQTHMARIWSVTRLMVNIAKIKEAWLGIQLSEAHVALEVLRRKQENDNAQ